MGNVAGFSADDGMIGAVKTDGTRWHWGATYRISDTKVKEGLMDVSCQSVPIQVSSNVKKTVGGGYYTVKPDGTVHSWRYDSSIMHQYTRGLSDIRLTDTSTPVSKPAAGAAGRFEDVLTTDFFYDAVNRAVERGITTGKSETRFAPYDKCTNGEAMIFIWRACGEPDVPTALQTRWNWLEEDDYRYVPYNWTFTYLDPMFLQEFGSHGGGCTRAQIMTFLQRYFERV